MIKTNESVFHLQTNTLSYIFHTDDLGLLFHDYFGNKVELVDFDVKPIRLKPNDQKGTSTNYDEVKDPDVSMD